MATDKQMKERRFGTGTKIPQQSPQQLKQSARQQLSPPQQQTAVKPISPKPLTHDPLPVASKAGQPIPMPAPAGGPALSGVTKPISMGSTQATPAPAPGGAIGPIAPTGVTKPISMGSTQATPAAAPGGWKKGGKVKTKCYAKGGAVRTSASSRGDGCATKGHTKGAMR